MVTTFKTCNKNIHKIFFYFYFLPILPILHGIFSFWAPHIYHSLSNVIQRQVKPGKCPLHHIEPKIHSNGVILPYLRLPYQCVDIYIYIEPSIRYKYILFSNYTPN